MNPYDLRYQVKQYVAEIQGERARFRVFESGDPKYYLFDMITEDGISTCFQVPVPKNQLKPHIRSALRNGWGNA